MYEGNVSGMLPIRDVANGDIKFYGGKMYEMFLNATVR